MTGRERLSNRRGNRSLPFEYEGHRYRVTAGRYPDGRLAEIFLVCPGKLEAAAVECRQRRDFDELTFAARRFRGGYSTFCYRSHSDRARSLQQDRCAVMMDPRIIVAAMGGVVTGPDTCSIPGPGHSNADRSLSIKIDPTDPLGFKVNSFSGDDWQTCRDYIAAALGLKYQATRRVTGEFPQLKKTKTTGSESHPSEFPLQLWSEAVNARGTLAEKYLTSRQLALPDRHEQVLRFHPSCPFGNGVRLPCMVAICRDIKTNEPKAIHRTALTPDGKKIDRKVLGPKAGCAIKLDSDEGVSEGLTIAEGL